MNDSSIITASALLGLVLVAPGSAQDRGTEGQRRPQDPSKTAPDAQDETRGGDRALRPDRPFHTHDELFGLAVHAPVPNGDGERTTLGAIDDIVVDGRTGRITHVVVATDRRLRALPWARLAWSRDAEGATVVTASVKPTAFAALPVLEERDANLIVGRRAAESSSDAAGSKRDARATDGRPAGTPREASDRVPRSHLIGDLVGTRVFAEGARESVSRVTGLVVDCQGGRVAFATMNLEKRTRLVPVETLAFRTSKAKPAEGEEPETRTVLSRSQEAMHGAPAIDAEKGETANNPRYRAAVYRFYRLADPDAPAKRQGDRSSRTDRGADGEANARTSG